MNMEESFAKLIGQKLADLELRQVHSASMRVPYVLVGKDKEPVIRTATVFLVLPELVDRVHKACNGEDGNLKSESLN